MGVGILLLGHLATFLWDILPTPSWGIEFLLVSEVNDSRSGGQGERGRAAPNGASSASPGVSGVEAPIFAAEPEERGGIPLAAWGVAALIAVVIVGALVSYGWKKPVPAPSTLLPADAYAASLPLTQFEMSESANLTGGKLTYLDGHIGNTGDRTVDAVTVQAVFQNDIELAPQIYTVPLTLIRMKEPYIDTEPVRAAPLKPGDDREFRLTFETVPENWNQQMPEVRIVHAELR